VLVVTGVEAGRVDVRELDGGAVAAGECDVLTGDRVTANAELDSLGRLQLAGVLDRGRDGQRVADRRGHVLRAQVRDREGRGLLNLLDDRSVDFLGLSQAELLDRERVLVANGRVTEVDLSFPRAVSADVDLVVALDERGLRTGVRASANSELRTGSHVRRTRHRRTLNVREVVRILVEGHCPLVDRERRRDRGVGVFELVLLNVVVGVQEPLILNRELDIEADVLVVGDIAVVELSIGRVEGDVVLVVLLIDDDIEVRRAQIEDTAVLVRPRTAAGFLNAELDGSVIVERIGEVGGCEECELISRVVVDAEIGSSVLKRTFNPARADLVDAHVVVRDIAALRDQVVLDCAGKLVNLLVLVRADDLVSVVVRGSPDLDTLGGRFLEEHRRDVVRTVERVSGILIVTAAGDGARRDVVVPGGEDTV